MVDRTNEINSTIVDFENKTIQDGIYLSYKEKVMEVLSKRDFYVGNIINKYFKK